MNKYISRAESNGVKSVEGQMMWAEIQHLGGVSAVTRIFEKIPKDSAYTCDDWLTALKYDQYDSYYSVNGVGSKKYWSRHEKCVEFIRKYADLGNSEGKVMGTTAKQIIERARHYIGYREKNHASADMESFTADAGDGNFQKFQPLAGAGNGDQWCQYFVDGVAVEITGSIEKAKELLCQTNSGNYMTGYTPDGAQYFKNAGRWYTVPEPGDVVYFYSTSMGRICHVGYVESVNKSAKTFTTIEGNTNSDGFTTNGGCVARHEYSYASVGGSNRVRGFGRPKYTSASFDMLKRGDTGSTVKELQNNLVLVGYVDCTFYTSRNFADGDFGGDTENSVKLFQKANVLEVDGIYGEKSHAKLTELVAKAKKSDFSKTVDEFLKEAKNVADYVRKNNFKYGNAPALPSVYPDCKMTSCDRFVDQTLYACGLTDVGNREVKGLEKYLTSKKAIRITNQKEIAAGDIVKLTTGHIFILGKKSTGSNWQRFDCGSDNRIKSTQPFAEPIEQFECAYRLPFVTSTQRLVKIGQQHSVNFTGNKIEIDGVRGVNTTKNMIRCLQKAANSDWNAGLEVDGIIGTKTRNAFKGHYIKVGETQFMVTAVEIICYCLGRDPLGVEHPGIFGVGLSAALKASYLSGEDILKLVE